jgi:hypothetical protein
MGSMSPSRRVALTVVLLAVLALNLACPGPPPAPMPIVCSTPAASAVVDELLATARVERGGQGITMVATDLQWIGAGAPECAGATLRLLDRDGIVYDTLEVALATEPTANGRRAQSSAYFLLGPEPCGAVVEVTSYGRTIRVDVEGREQLFCPPSPDAGAEDGS